MKIPLLREILDKVSSKLKEEGSKRPFAESSVGSTSLAQETMSLRLSSENNLFAKKNIEANENKSFQPMAIS